jgi:membrane fusion protein (multidrug efflux system)
VKKWIITGAALAIAAVLIIIFLPRRGKVEKKEIPLVEFTQVSRGTVARTLDVVGYVVPTRQSAAIARSYGKVKSIYPDEVGLEFEPQPIKAPISGVVASIMVKEGEPAAPGTALAAVVDPSSVEVEVSLPGEDYVQIREGSKAFLYLDSDTIPARVKSKAPVVDPATRTFKVTLAPQKRPQDFLPGLSVAAKLVLAERENVLLVPQTALEDSSLLVISADSVIRRTVGLGLSGEGVVEIRSGIGDTDRIVTFGGKTLKSGQKVRIVER